MENCLRPWILWSFLQNNNHLAVKKTDCFVVSQLFSVARHVGRLKLGSKPTQLYVRLSIRLLGQQAYHVSLGIISY